MNRQGMQFEEAELASESNEKRKKNAAVTDLACPRRFGGAYWEHGSAAASG